MRVLIVHSGNAVISSDKYSFIKEQGDALSQNGCIVSYFPILGKGAKGYLDNLSKLKNTISSFHPDIIHAHYGLSGALSILQRKVPVVITFHNGETLTKKGLLISSIASLFSSYNIYVAQHIYEKMIFHPKRHIIQPCGVWLNKLTVFEKKEAMESMGLSKQNVNILFGGSFSNLRKNYALANESIQKLNLPNINLIEMKGWTREEVNKLLCGCDMLLLTTKSEGSPQVIKEALACNCPIVATNVADIPFLLTGVSNSVCCNLDSNDISKGIVEVIENSKRSNGRERIVQLNLDNDSVAKNIINVYNKVLKNGKRI